MHADQNLAANDARNAIDSDCLALFVSIREIRGEFLICFICEDLRRALRLKIGVYYS